MAPVDTRDDRKVREAEVFCYSEHMEMASIGQLCNLAFKALQMQTSMMELARSLKVKLDEKFPGQWMVIIGKTFGAYLTVDARNFVHFRIGRTYFMLHKQH